MQSLVTFYLEMIISAFCRHVYYLVGAIKLTTILCDLYRNSERHHYSHVNLDGIQFKYCCVVILFYFECQRHMLHSAEQLYI